MIIECLKYLLYLFPSFGAWKIIPTPDATPYLSRNQKYIDMVVNSPTRYIQRVRLSTGMVFLNANEKLTKKYTHVELPFLIMHGKDDKITDPNLSIKFYDKASSKLKYIKLYKNTQHLLLNEQPLCIQDSNNFMNELLNI